MAITSRRMGWVGHVVCISEMRNAYKIMVGIPEEKSPLENPRICGMIILKCTLKNQCVKIWTGSSGSCEHDIEPSASIKDGEFLDYLSDY
jgi:hypothetical protein